MKKNFLILLLAVISISQSAFSQEGEFKHSVLISPGSLILGRANLRYEKIRESHISYGSRLEASLWTNPDFGKHIWVIPYVRYYPFSKELNGLYSELGVGYRLEYAKAIDAETGTAYDVDYFKSAAVCRFYLGGQWFVGKKSKIPFDVGLGLNIDTQVGKIPEDIAMGSVLAGPLSVLSLRIQTGLSF